MLRQLCNDQTTVRLLYWSRNFPSLYISFTRWPLTDKLTHAQNHKTFPLPSNVIVIYKLIFQKF